jgi:hypothetical protein
MNRKWILLAIALPIAMAAGAQRINVGLKAGLNLSANEGNGMSSSLQQGIDAGAFAEINLGKKWGIQPEAYFSQRNTRRADDFTSKYYINEGLSGSDQSVKLSYISVPVLLKYNISSVFSLQAGPQFDFLVFEDDNLLKSGRNAFKKTDMGIAAGGTLTLEKFRIYGRYTWGLSNINDVDDRYKWKSRQLQLGVALSLFSVKGK